MVLTMRAVASEPLLDLLDRRGEAIHAVDAALDARAAALGHALGFLGVGCVLLTHAGNFLQARGDFFDRGRLFGGALRQQLAARGDLLRGDGDLFGGAGDFSERVIEVSARRC